jgi:adhesin transport system membrane fusion protein
MYAIEIKFKNDFLDTAGQIVEILPGMVAQVDVVRGERSILEYIWQPVAKIKDDAFRQ